MLTFEDADGFDRAALRSAALCATLALFFGVLEGTASTARLGGRFAPGFAIGCALLASVLAAQRRKRAQQLDEPLRSRWLAAGASLLAAVSGLFAVRALPALAGLLAAIPDTLGFAPPQAICASLACALCGAALGLWLACCTLPLHLRRAGSSIERRCVQLRFSLGPELRPIAERIAQAHREALASLRERGPVAAMPIRATLDQLALVSLELASKLAALARAAPPRWEVHARSRRDELLERAGQSLDTQARSAFERAAAAQAQIAERSQQLVAGRERMLSRLHEEVAELERARAALALLTGAAAEHAASEIDLLDERLRAGTAVAESFGEAERESISDSKRGDHISMRG